MSSSFKVSVVGEYKDEGASQGLRDLGQAAVDNSQQITEANQTLASASEVAVAATGAMAQAQQASSGAMDSASASADSLASAQGNISQTAEQAAQAEQAFADSAKQAEQAAKALEDAAGKVLEKMASWGTEGLGLANDLEQTAERISNMGLTSAETATQMDVMRKMSYDTGTSMSDLAAASEIAARAGASVPDVLDEINILATATGKSVTEAASAYSQAQQGLSRGVMALNKQFGISRQELEALGVEYNASGRVVVKTAEQQQTLKKALEEIVNTKYADAIAKHSASLQGAYDDLGSTIERLKADFGADLAPYVQAAANAMTALLKTFEALSPSVRTSIEVVTAAAVAWVALGKAAGVVASAYSTWSALTAAATASSTANTVATTANTAATGANTVARGANTAAATAGTTANGLLTASIGTVTKALWAQKAACAEVAIILVSLAQVARLVDESSKAVAAYDDTSNQMAADQHRVTKALNEHKSAYSELSQEIGKYGVKMTSELNAGTVREMQNNGLSLEKLKEYKDRVQEYAYASTLNAQMNSDNPNADRFAKQAESARKAYGEVSKLVDEYAKYDKLAQTTPAETPKTEVKATAPKGKTAEQLQAEQDRQTEQRASQMLTDLERERTNEIERQGRDRLEAITEYINIYSRILAEDTEIADNAKARQSIEDKIYDLAEQRHKLEQEILDKRTDSAIEDIETKRNKLVKDKVQTEDKSYDSAIAKLKQMLRSDTQIANNAKERAKVEKQLVEYAEKRKKAEEEIAKLRKDAADALADAEEKYRDMRISTLDDEIGQMDAKDPRKAKLQEERNKLQAESNKYELSQLDKEFVEKTKNIDKASDLYKTYEKTWQIERKTLEAQQRYEAEKQVAEDNADRNPSAKTKTVTLSDTTKGILQSQGLSTRATQMDGNAQTISRYTATGTTLNEWYQQRQAQQMQSQTETASTSATDTSKIDQATSSIEQSTSALSSGAEQSASSLGSLASAASSAAPALQALASISASGSGSGSSNSYNFNINGTSGGQGVNETAIAERASSMAQQAMSDRDKYNGVIS